MMVDDKSGGLRRLVAVTRDRLALSRGDGDTDKPGRGLEGATAPVPAPGFRSRCPVSGTADARIVPGSRSARTSDPMDPGRLCAWCMTRCRACMRDA